MNDKKQRIVVLGGGFGGVYTALYLESLLGHSHDFEIVLVNRENYFVFQPMLAEVVSGNIGILDTVSPIRRLLKKTQLFIRDVDAVDLEKKTVTLAPGFWPRALVLEFDHLVLALGSVTDFRGIPGLYEHALPFKNLADAVRLRNHVIRAVEEACIEPDPELRRQLLTFVVAGGGFSGTEVVAEMNDFVRKLVKQSHMLDGVEPRIVLVHSGQRVLERELKESLSVYATEILRKKGIELILGQRLRTASPDAAILKDGERIKTKTVVSTVPGSPHPILETLDLPNERGKIKVTKQLGVEDRPGVWALGDCALVPNADGDGFCPPTAQHAIRQGKTLAHNIVVQIRGGEPKEFDFSGLGKMGSLGHRSAVVEAFGMQLSGFIAWVMWRAVYWMKLPGFDRKIKVGLAWLLDLMIPPESVQLRLSGEQGVQNVHYEPGEIIFNQGDLGDCLYIILDGKVEVVCTENCEERVVAELGAGEHFGEMALLNERTRNATVRCKEALNVLSLRKAEFSALSNNLPELRGSVEATMEKRVSAEQ